MSRGFLLPWVLLALWGTWLQALQGSLAELGPRVDLGLLLYFAVAARAPREDLPRAAVVVALARSAVSIDPPVAILSGFLAVALLVAAARSIVDLRSAWMRVPLCALLAWALAGWLAGVHEARHPELASAPATAFSGELLVQAVTTGLAAWILCPLLARLPGLGTFDRGRPWAIAASRP